MHLNLAPGDAVHPRQVSRSAAALHSGALAITPDQSHATHILVSRQSADFDHQSAKLPVSERSRQHTQGESTTASTVCQSVSVAQPTVNGTSQRQPEGVSAAGLCDQSKSLSGKKSVTGSAT